MNRNKCGFTKYHFFQIITIIIRIKINKITKQTNIKKQNKYINKKKKHVNKHNTNNNNYANKNNKQK